MTTLKKNTEFVVSGNADLEKETIEYFTKSGFKHVSKLDGRNIKFERGSVASNMWTFNPLKWKSEIDIKISGQEVKAKFNIDATGQLVTPKEEALWDFFIDSYKKYLNDRSYDFIAENDKTLRTTKNNSLKYIGWALLGGLIAGIPAGIIAYWTGINSIVSVGAAGGAIAFLIKKIDDEKKNNQA